MAMTTAQLVDKEPEKIASFLLLETETYGSMYCVLFIPPYTCCVRYSQEIFKLFHRLMEGIIINSFNILRRIIAENKIVVVKVVLIIIIMILLLTPIFTISFYYHPMIHTIYVLTSHSASQYNSYVRIV
jgi:hypothetical protein